MFDELELFDVLDVEESELSCSTPLETQPVIATAIRAHATTEVISFFINYSLPNSNNFKEVHLYQKPHNAA